MKSKRIIIYCIGGLAILAIVFGVFNSYFSNVELKKIAEIQTEVTYAGDYWMMITDKNIDEIKTYGIDKHDLNLNECNIVVPFGREIKEMKYKKKKLFHFTISKFTKTVFKKNFIPI